MSASGQNSTWTRWINVSKHVSKKSDTTNKMLAWHFRCMHKMKIVAGILSIKGLAVELNTSSILDRKHWSVKLKDLWLTECQNWSWLPPKSLRPFFLKNLKCNDLNLMCLKIRTFIYSVLTSHLHLSQYFYLASCNFFKQGQTDRQTDK